MTSREGTAGGTGFLFGNIDRRGRLDEDYMSDDAKDTIDNVGSKVVEKDRDLRELAEALPQKGRDANSDDDDYDDDALDTDQAPAARSTPAAGSVDYFDEKDALDDGMVDDAERTQMASVALRDAEQRAPASTLDDDENYDDEEPEDPSPAAPSIPSQLRPLDPALVAQRRLMEQARLASAAAVPSSPENAEGTPGEVSAAVDDDPEDDVVAFSRIFTKPVRPLRYVPKRRRRFGFVIQGAPPVPVPEPDDVETLEREHSPTVVDPVKVILELDADDAAVRNPIPKPRPPPRIQTKEDLFAGVDMEEYKAAAVPLVEALGEEDVQEAVQEDNQEDVHEDVHEDVREEDRKIAADFSMVEQAVWEDKIQWKDPDDDEEEEPWYVSDTEAGDIGESSSGNGAALETEDADDDEDEFEEPVMMNVSKPEFSANVQKDTNSDSDDDMEWVDGLESVPEAGTMKEAVSRPSPVHVAKPLGGLLSGLGKMKVKEPAKPPPSDGNATNKSIVEGNKNPAKDPFKLQLRSVPHAVPKSMPRWDFSKTVIAANKDLEEGLWLKDVIWESQSEGEHEPYRKELGRQKALSAGTRFSRLILDMNDSNMIFEHLSDSSDEKNAPPPKVAESNNPQVRTARMGELIHSSGTHVQQLLESDRFNISYDLYYSSGASNFMKVDRRSILRGLQNAPPAVKCLTTKTILSEAELLSFRRPVLRSGNLPKNIEILPFRRRRPKGGNAQIAGQIPKKKAELLCSEKDAYRVSLYEYALERQPCILPIPGMASRIVTYARKDSAAAAQQALKDVAGTPDADTVFMSPDEPPPLHAGDLEANGKPLSVVESHVYAAPCVRCAPQSEDFLMVRSGNKMYVREIDSVVSLGVTEPKVEVMAPNTERFKRYSRDRAFLTVLREFSRMRKETQKLQKTDRRGNRDMPPDPPALDKASILEFMRKKTNNTEGVFLKMLKEISAYKNGKFVMIDDPAKSLGAREAEMLRTVTPQETAACEAMEAGMQNLLDRGIQVFTHPSNQGNITLSAEKSGLEAGPAVGAYIKSQLLRSPWFRSQNIVSGQKQQKKELLQVLSLAKIVNDLKEGGAVMEAKLMSLTAAEMNNVLQNQYRLNHKKIPTDIEERRLMVRDMALKKGKSNAHDMSDYATLIRNVLKKHRNAGVAKSGANGIPNPSSTSGTFLGLPLEMQRVALEDGDVSQLPVEEEDFAADIDVAAVLAANNEDAFGKLPEPKTPSKCAVKKGIVRKLKVPPKKPSTPAPQVSQNSENAEEREELHKLLKSSAVNSNVPSSSADAKGDSKKKSKRKVLRLKVTTKGKDANGKPTSVVKTITDPEEIARMLEKQKRNPKKGSSDAIGPVAAPNAGTGAPNRRLKIAIDLKKLHSGGKAIKKKKTGIKKATPKLSPNPAASSGSTIGISKTAGEKGQIGKLKINTKQLRQDKEEAALKRKRSQYGEDIEYRVKKTAKTSRRKRNGRVQLNNILEKVETTVRETEGYVATVEPVLRVERLREGESAPVGKVANNLAVPKGTGLDFTAPVDTKMVPLYKSIVKKPMYLNLIRQNCKRMSYSSVAEFRADMELIVKNASAFNKTPDVQWVVQHAELLLEVAVEQLSRKADEISAAEEMIKEEVSKASQVPPPNSTNKKKRMGEKKGEKKKGDRKKKSASGEVVVIPDGSDKEVEILNSSGPVIDLDEPSGGGPMDSQPSPAASSLPAASPPPAASPLFGAGMTDDIYSMDGPLLATDGMDNSGPQAETLVLDLDDIGVGDGP